MLARESRADRRNVQVFDRGTQTNCDVSGRQRFRPPSPTSCGFTMKHEGGKKRNDCDHTESSPKRGEGLKDRLPVEWICALQEKRGMDYVPEKDKVFFIRTFGQEPREICGEWEFP